MIFNYDLMTWITFFTGAFICCFGSYISGKLLLNKKIKLESWFSYFMLVILSILTVFNSLIFENIIVIFGTILILFLIFKIILKENLIDSFLYSIVVYILILISEVTVSLIMVVFDSLFKINLYNDFIKSIFINIVILFISCFYANLIKDRIRIIVSKINKYSVLSILVLGIITIFIMLSSMYNLYLNNWLFDYKFILNMVIFIGCVTLLLNILTQYLKNREIEDRYILLQDYLKTSAELIEKYSSTVHRYKNNLIAIKGYIKTSNLEAEHYIDNLLENYNNKKYNWIKKINYIEIKAIRYLIYYKLSKAENSNLKIMVDVSNNVKEYDSNSISNKQSNTLLDILGEYFDNAIYASNESKEKELNFVMYEENQQLIIVLANTFVGNINLALISKNGYTTKGKDHGFGLYDVEKSIRDNTWLNCKYEIIDNYFTVTLKLDLKKND